MRPQVTWSNNFLNPADTLDFLLFIGRAQFSQKEVMGDWLKTPFAEIDKIRNTLALLIMFGVLETGKNGKISRDQTLNIPDDIDGLTTLFENLLINHNQDVLLNLIPYDKLSFNEKTGNYGFYRNCSPLKYSGGLNLLIGFGLVKQIDRYSLEISSDKFKKIIIEKVERAVGELGSITPEALRKLIESKRLIGDKSEELAFNYEKSRLSKLGITKTPIRVSLLDVTKGYDISSYESIKSKGFDRFIEVKTFNDKSFYISKSELNKARLLRKKYFLYLVKSDPKEGSSIKEIQDPAESFNDHRNWGLEPSEYMVRWIA